MDGWNRPISLYEILKCDNSRTNYTFGTPVCTFIIYYQSNHMHVHAHDLVMVVNSMIISNQEQLQNTIRGEMKTRKVVQSSTSIYVRLKPTFE